MMYNTLAHYYDALVKDDQAARSWADWVESFHPGNRFLELACGSGEITGRLAQHHAVEAMDLSEQMVQEASKKEALQNVVFRCGDMTCLAGYGQYDAIGCFCDSFNYILEKETVVSFFEQVANHLVPGGLFFFDTHSLDRLEEFAEDYEETGQFDDGTQVQWIISAEDDILYQDFAFYTPETTVQEHHMQRVYDPAWLIGQLKMHFDILSVTTDWETEGIGPGEKYFFVCRKKDTR